MKQAAFADTLLDWHEHHGRHDLPWQQPRTPYRVWLSEIMLQQTQVQIVIGYFERFVAALPTLPALASASEDEVLALWSGLGYYSRARNLHAAARRCMAEHGGELPSGFDALLALPGIGRSTAGAILAQAHGQRRAILDGNVKRLLARYHGIEGWPGNGATERRLWQLAEAHLPARRLADYTQALMDFGATLCTRTRPRCQECPLRSGCTAFSAGSVQRLPAPRPAKQLPQRECVMAVLIEGSGRVLLQRRPPSGIWGGLWSLPEYPDLATASAWIERSGMEPGGAGAALQPLEHGFTHFRLRILPVRWQVACGGARTADDDTLRWFTREAIPGVGMPAPVRRLLEAAMPPARGGQVQPTCAAAAIIEP